MYQKYYKPTESRRQSEDMQGRRNNPQSKATQYEGYIVLHENDGFDIMLKKPCVDH